MKAVRKTDPEWSEPFLVRAAEVERATAVAEEALLHGVSS